MQCKADNKPTRLRPSSKQQTKISPPDVREESQSVVAECQATAAFILASSAMVAIPVLTIVLCVHQSAPGFSLFQLLQLSFVVIGISKTYKQRNFSNILTVNDYMNNRFTWFQTIFLWQLCCHRYYNSSLLANAQNHNDLYIPFFEGPADFGFIGNSYTSYNNLPNMFKEIVGNGIPEWADSVYTEAFNPGGLSLGDHLERLESGSSRIRDMLIEQPREWKWVILQDQSQIPGFFDVNWGTPDNVYTQSENGAQVINEHIAETEGQTMFYMTWGRMNGDTRNPSLFPDFWTMQEQLAGGYLRYVELTSTPERPTFVAPVGLVFHTIYRDVNSQGVEPTTAGSLFHSLYNRDESHPSPTGSYVAALTLYATMFGLDPEAITWWPNQIDEATARTLQEAVSRTILTTHDSGYITYPWTVPWTERESSGPPPVPDPTPAPSVMPETPAPVPDPTPAPSVMPETPAPVPDSLQSPVTPEPSVPQTEALVSSSPSSTETWIPTLNNTDDRSNETMWELVLQESFENATTSIFTELSSINAQITDWYASKGAYSLELRHNGSFVSAMILADQLEDWIVNPELQEMRLTFDYLTLGQIVDGEGFVLRGHNGNLWEVIQSFEKGIDWTMDDEWYTTSVTWPANQTTEQLQFLSSFRGTDDIVFIDYIRLEVTVLEDAMTPTMTPTGVNDTVAPSLEPTSNETEAPSLAPSTDEPLERSSEARNSGVFGAKSCTAALSMATLLGTLLWISAF